MRKQELTAQEWFERGFNALDADEQIRCYTEAIRLNPDDADGYYNRALLYEIKDHYAAAAADFQIYLDLVGGVRDGDQAETEKRIRRLKKSG